MFVSGKLRPVLSGAADAELEAIPAHNRAKAPNVTVFMIVLLSPSEIEHPLNRKRLSKGVRSAVLDHPALHLSALRLGEVRGSGKIP
jgi:hypothetical protein